MTKSNLIQKLTRSKLSRYLIPWFAGYYQVNLSQLKQPIQRFPHLESFFTRELQADARPFDPSQDVLVSPVDGKLSVVSDISADDTFLVKGKTYHLSKLLGNSDEAAKYHGGQVLILYLSPADYHRIHAPLTAKELEHKYLGKWSWPVNDWGLKYTKGLTGNYRLVSQFEAQGWQFAMVSVGALNVNSIVRLSEADIVYQKMDPYGYFSFGSTVVLVFQKGAIQLDSLTSRQVKAGERLGLVQSIT